MNAIWITWERQRRNLSMSALLEAKYFELTYSGSRIIRYFYLGMQTWNIIRRERPDVVYYQNPSIVLACLTTLIHLVCRGNFKLVGDYHNAGIYPPLGISSIKYLVKFLCRRADLILVSNDILVDVLESWGCTAMAFPDPLPRLQKQKVHSKPPPIKHQVLFICSWAEDEPIEQVIQAANSLSRAEILITGRPNHKRYPIAQSSNPNITLTGYLSEQEFDTLLHTCNLVIDLTTRDDCMVCGAYEGIAAGKPLILSNNPPTKAYFSQGALFCDNTAGDIAQKIEQACKNLSALTSDAEDLRNRLHKNDRTHRERLLSTLESPYNDYQAL